MSRSGVGHSYTAICLVVLLLLFVPLTEAKPTRLTLACAANFSATMNKLVTLFELQTKEAMDIRVSVGSSGSLATQIQHGAPYDVFLSADKHYVELLTQAGFGHDRAPYALGELVLYSLDKSPQGLDLALMNTAKATVVIANPKHAPYGRAAEQILQRHRSKPKRLVKGNSVLQAFQYVESGHAQYGLIAKSLLKPGFKGQWFDIPAHWYDPIEQHALLLAEHSAARAFFEFIQSDDAQQLIKASGYR
ncbi:molybdate ABC transporter substrate-binding protein [Pseudoalteromonas rubra]|uniref:molybdate ABC transporter substrate-binding protein n=1 Tax=Pseudoalteromonas rubra TaxID=43658 RepID=UPI0011089AB6|nr:molybdate ABC transporter substrate-binding protein [Pseudoalteromonas rubra]